MFIKSLRVGFVGFVLSVATAWAGPSAIQGVVKEKGQPIRGADVRIDSKDGSQRLNTVKTDGKGHYISEGLAPGVYRVTLMVNGAVKASIGNTKTKSNQATELNFDLKPVSASQASAKQKRGKHLVWVPANTGTHVGGRWVEIDDSANPNPGTLNVQQVDGEEMQRQQRSTPMRVPGQ